MQKILQSSENFDRLKLIPKTKSESFTIDQPHLDLLHEFATRLSP